jgi:hypothetical protein
MDATKWLELFQVFSAVNRLRPSSDTGSLVSRTLQRFTAENATEVWPALRDLFEGDDRELQSTQSRSCLRVSAMSAKYPPIDGKDNKNETLGPITHNFSQSFILKTLDIISDTTSTMALDVRR